ncbi:hypothetical protein Nepgr_008922 [Nepenthes gracilis]|uniref:Uncharacterized protein n=1 Tax=Nepenthes gracilis TaxID=150966 RepID=A0AAD3SAD9_NEPGR|nr:hypothetical protein Nepgr_008922 [Nepenthes gracilis]
MVLFGRIAEVLEINVAKVCGLHIHQKMDGVACNEGLKRTLPPWMLRVTATDQACNPESRCQGKDDDLDELVGKDSKSKPVRIKQQGPKVQSNEKESIKANSCLLKECMAKGSKRKPNKQDVHNSGCIPGVDPDKENYVVAGGRFHGDASSKKKKEGKLKAKPRNETAKSIPSEELTVEDLISIAEEFVNAGKDKEQQLSSCTTCESESQPPLTILSKNESGNDPNAVKGDGMSLKDASAASDSEIIESLPNEGSIISSSKTGDPAQDMLDLFLGPLLKRPKQVERKAEVLTERILLDYELSKLSQDSAVGNAAPPTKKKGSLKNEIAMLLN